ncbi:MAG: MBL fold metallo-hydrolase [Gemmatimonadota bacterium]
MAAAPAAPLAWRHIPAGEQGFYRAPVLITGATEAVLVDGGFTYSDGRAVVEAIKATGKPLRLIYVSQSDPDYYFNLKPIAAAFPHARVVAASATVAAIQASVEKKLAVWGPQLKDNGPQTMADVVIPEAADGGTLTVDGETIEIVDAAGLPNRRYLWIPQLQAVIGGVLLFSGVHVWTADTRGADQRAAWRATLDAIADRHPAIVVPGHMAPTAALDGSAIRHTKAWLVAFEEELAKAASAAALSAAMKGRFPGLGMEIAIDIGSKVAMGEMQWG